MDKQEVRAAAKRRRAVISAKEWRQCGAQMAVRLFSLPQWQKARTVLAFCAMPDEPDTTLVLRRTLADGKRLCLPRVQAGQNGAMAFVPVENLSALALGAYGILEPTGPALPAGTAFGADTLALVPCLAADEGGVRLGRGGGYYDRFLARYQGQKLLLCPTALLLPEHSLPAEAWDICFAPGEVLTEDNLL